MIKTFTPSLEITAEQTEKDQENPSFQAVEPSVLTIQNILNFSRNLEIRTTAAGTKIEFIKS
jgi:hypothetical protein